MQWTSWIPAGSLGLSAVFVGLESLADSAPAREFSAREVIVLGRICAHCHAQPGIGVPLIGDEAEWKSRRALGLEVLVARTIEGAGNMPPLGTCSFCTEDELRHLVAFMAGIQPDDAQ